VGMMKCIVTYYELATKAIVETSKKADKITYSYLKLQTNNQFNKLKDMKFLVPTLSKQEITNYFRTFLEEIITAFKQLMEK
jgi:V-type H+-transporting ATPase subunit A